VAHYTSVLSHVKLHIVAAHPFQDFLGGGGNDWGDEVVNAAVANKDGQLSIGSRNLRILQSTRSA
jgi:hypothetical protein